MTLSHIKLRRLIGILGGSLPFLLLATNYFINTTDLLNNSNFILEKCTDNYVSEGSYKYSISHYYYTPAAELFTGILITVAIFLFSYKGHPLKEGELPISDELLTNIAASSALGIVLFPTGNGDQCINDNFRIFVASETTGVFHFIFASIFFISLALIAIYNFRRTAELKDFGKGKHHNFYRICGFGILTCLMLIFIYVHWIEDVFVWLDNLHPVFILETIALLFFSTCWLVKGNVEISNPMQRIKNKRSKSAIKTE